MIISLMNISLFISDRISISVSNNGKKSLRTRFVLWMIWRKRLFNIFVPTVVIFAQRPSLRSTGCLTITMTRSWSLSRSRKWSWKRIFVYIEDRVCYRWKLANRAWFWESYWRGEADSCDSCMWSTSLRLWWLEGGVWEARERAIREGEGEEGR